MKAEQHPLQHAECIAKNFTDISGNNYCSAEGLMDVSSSGITSEKESMYNSELRMCKEKIPAGSETESSSSSVTDAESSSSSVAASGDMVSCDVPGVMGGCEEAPAGSEEANFSKERSAQAALSNSTVFSKRTPSAKCRWCFFCRLPVLENVIVCHIRKIFKFGIEF